MAVLACASPRVTEADFDRLITGAGGQRCNADATVQATPNADYELGDTILELKLIEEEGLQKGERQRKLAELFRCTQPDHPVVVLDPTSLDAEAERRYFNILAGPIQTAVKKAAQQLESTRAVRRSESTRVLIVINTATPRCPTTNSSRSFSSRLEMTFATSTPSSSEGCTTTPMNPIPMRCSPSRSTTYLDDSDRLKCSEIDGANLRMK